MERTVRSDGMCISWNRKEGIGGKERKDRKARSGGIGRV